MKSPTVLVVDDEPEILNLSKSFLEPYGYEVLTAPNGLKGKSVFDAASDSIDILVTDIEMGEGIHGLALATYVRSVNPNVRIVIMSGRMDLFEEEARKITQHLLKKPFEFRYLYMYISKVYVNDSTRIAAAHS